MSAITFHVCEIESAELAAKGFKFYVAANDAERRLVESEQIAAQKGRLYRSKKAALEAKAASEKAEALRA